MSLTRSSLPRTEKASRAHISQTEILPPGLTQKCEKEETFQRNKGDKIQNLLRWLANFKAWLEYNNHDFSVDRVKQYKAVQYWAMARIYEDKHTIMKSLLFLCKYLSLLADMDLTGFVCIVLMYT